METLGDIESDIKSILIEVKERLDNGPTEENVHFMVEKQGEMADIVSRLENLPDE